MEGNWSEIQDYRTLMREELASRIHSNPRYSLRAFARDLDLAPSRLCAILKGRQGLSRESAGKVAARMRLVEGHRELFCDLVEARHARSPMKRRLALSRLEQRKLQARQTLPLDAFRVISDWHHFALLELAALPGFRSDPEWVASRLGIDADIAAAAIERLLRLQLLRKDDSGSIRPTEDATFSPDDVPSEAIRNFHRQVLGKALEAISSQPVEERDLNAVFLSIGKEDIPRAKRMIREFRASFGRKLAPRSPDRVYCLAVQFFRLDQQRGLSRKGGN